MTDQIKRIFLQQQKISKHLYCAICHQIFDDPNRMQCGHTFCYKCIQQWAARSKVCPICKKSLRNRKPQKQLTASHIIDDLMTKCCHANCNWTGVYSVLRKHQRRCDFREKKQFQPDDLNNAVELNDDSQVKQTVNISKSGKKKIKASSEVIVNMPVFQSSHSQNSQNNDEIVNFQRYQIALNGQGFIRGAHSQNNNNNSGSGSQRSSNNSLNRSFGLQPQQLPVRNLRQNNNNSKQLHNSTGVFNIPDNEEEQNDQHSQYITQNQQQNKPVTLSQEIRNISFDEYDEGDVAQVPSKRNSRETISCRTRNQNRKLIRNLNLIRRSEIANSNHDHKGKILWSRNIKQKPDSSQMSQNSSDQSNPYQQKIKNKRNEIIQIYSDSEDVLQKNQLIKRNWEEEEHKNCVQQQKQSGQMSNLGVPFQTVNKSFPSIFTKIKNDSKGTRSSQIQQNNYLEQIDNFQKTHQKLNKKDFISKSFQTKQQIKSQIKQYIQYIPQEQHIKRITRRTSIINKQKQEKKQQRLYRIRSPKNIQ